MDDLEALANAAQRPTHVQATRRMPNPPAVVYVRSGSPPRKQYSPFAWGCGIMLGILAALLFVFVALPLIIAAVGAGAAATKRANQQQQPSPPPTAASAVSPIVTLDEYNRIVGAITYERVVAIVGDEGTHITYDGLGRAYQWANEDGSQMTLYFRNGRVESKEQTGLR
jgi:hypothetical protein